MDPDLDFETHRTPNPNSLKVTTRRRPFIASGMESYRSAEDAASHPLASALFEVSGVLDVFLVPAFVTVTKTPAAEWDTVWPEIERRIAGFLAD